jgi:uncharacterized protein YndB with AHSA1/START domain
MLPMVIEDRFLVQAPIDDVFMSIADPRWLQRAMLPRGVAIELETADPVGSGSRFRMVRGVRGPWFWEVTEFAPPTRLAVVVWWSERRGSGETTYELTSSSDGTVVSMRGSGYFGPVGRALLGFWPPFRAAVRRRNRQLATAIEQRPALDDIDAR